MVEVMTLVLLSDDVDGLFGFLVAAVGGLCGFKLFEAWLGESLLVNRVRDTTGMLAVSAFDTFSDNVLLSLGESIHRTELLVTFR